MNTVPSSSCLRGLLTLFAIFASWAVLAQDLSDDIAAERLSLPDLYETRLADLPVEPEFSELREIRNGIIQEISLLQAELDTVRSRLAAMRERQAIMLAERKSLDVREKELLDRVTADIQFFKSEISALEEQLDERAGPNPEIEANMKMFQQQLRGAEAEEERLDRNIERSNERESAIDEEVERVELNIDSAQAELAEKNRDLMSLRQMQSRLDVLINTLLIPENAQNEFKLWVTGAFSFLVGIVIIGFFVIAWSDETVRQSIFSSQSGIQFLTLFSLVIAIILFGITGILEGKELSALLGGLSGYILGRVGSSMDQAGGATPRPPASEGSPEAGVPKKPGK